MLNQLHTLLQSLGGPKLIVPITLAPLVLSLSGCHLSPYYFKMTPSNSTSKRSAYYNLQLGLAYLEVGNFVKAREKLLAAEQQQPKEIDILIGMAYLLERMGAWERAESYYLKALGIDARRGVACNNYGRFLCERGQYSQAEFYFLKAINDNRYVNVETAYENAGLCAMRAADKNKAIRYLKIAVQHNARLEKSWLALSQLHQSDEPLLAYQYLQQYQKVAKHPTSSFYRLQKQLVKQLNDKKIRVVDDGYETATDSC